MGVLVAILSALSFSLSNAAVRRGVVRVPVSQGAFLTVMLGIPLFVLACLVTGQLLRLDQLSAESYGLLALAGIIHYVIGRFFNYAAIGAIGAARSTPIQTLGLPYSVLIAYLFLDEGVTLGMIAGIVLIMIGPTIMVERRRAAVPVTAGSPAPGGDAEAPLPAAAATEVAPREEGFQLRQAEGYALAIIAAVSYGSSPVLIRSALEGESGVSVLGGLVSYVAAGALLTASLALPSRRSIVTTFKPAMLKMFFAAGFFVFLAQMFRFVALSLASVAVVTALLRFSGIFTLIIAWSWNRHLERITWQVVAGGFLSIAGAILLIATRP